MPNRFIDDSFWSDPFVDGLDADGICLYVYCTANPQQKQNGIFQVSVQSISANTKVAPDKVKTLLTQFEAKGIIKWYQADNRIWSKNFLKIHAQNLSFAKAALKHLRHESPELIEEYLQYNNDLGIWNKFKLSTEQIHSYIESDVSELKDRWK